MSYDSVQTVHVARAFQIFKFKCICRTKYAKKDELWILLLKISRNSLNWAFDFSSFFIKFSLNYRWVHPILQHLNLKLFSGILAKVFNFIRTVSMLSFRKETPTCHGHCDLDHSAWSDFAFCLPSQFKRHLTASLSSICFNEKLF